MQLVTVFALVDNRRIVNLHGSLVTIEISQGHKQIETLA
ncbi:hypothetical protein GALL_477820 [mine drainage metagenome]|uniref:Uncharacterized protein n=1 Tax=mine drainage metagenome TaxID=410659 RepID=A0A1J5PH99_9ZZZZ